MKNKTTAGITGYIDRVWIQNASTGAGLTGLAYNTAGLSMYYTRIGDTSTTAVSLATCTLGTYTSGGFKEVDATNLPGLYEVHYPNAMLATGARKVHAMLKGAASMQPLPIEIELDAADYLDGGRLGLTSLPAAAANGAGGLPVIGTNNNQFSSTLGNVKIANNGINSATFQSGAITSATFAANALGAVWDEARSSHTTAGTFGAYVLARDDSGATLATSSALSTAAGNITTILGQTGTTGVVVASSSKTGYSLTQAFPTNFASLAITGGGAVTAGTVSDKTGYSLSQSFPSNFASLAITVGGAVTVGTNSDKTGYSLATTPPTAAQIATQVWSEAVPGSYTSGQAGNTLGSVATGTPPTAAAIATQVWSTALPGSFTTGQAGNLLASASAPSAATVAAAVWNEAKSGHTTAGTYGYLLDTQLSTLATASNLSSVASNVTTILGQTGTTGVVVAASSKSGYSLTQSFPSNFASLAITAGGAVTAGTVSDKTGYSLTQSFPSNFASLSIDSSGRTVLAPAGLDAITVETGVNARQAMSPILAAAAGVLAGAGTGTITIKGGNVATTRITATTDSSGNRSAVTLTLPS